MPKDMSMPKEPGISKEMRKSNGNVGHLYIQTNENQNAIIHYHRSASDWAWPGKRSRPRMLRRNAILVGRDRSSEDVGATTI